jgi:hypothetical protein
MKKLGLLTLALVFALVSCKNSSNSGHKHDENCKHDHKKLTKQEVSILNGLTQKEMNEGWKLLFDGKTSKGWRGFKKQHFPKAWEVVDGTLHIKGSGRGEAGSKDGGDIIYDQQFENFHLSLEWKAQKAGNSGIFYLGQEGKYDYIWQSAPEMQVLDPNHPDAMLGKNGNRQAGSLYDLVPAKPQNVKPGQWNKAEVICYKGTVVHKQNGETVVEYHLWTEEWKKMVAGSKFPKLNKDWANVAKKGYFGVQDHGDDVWFRNIKIKELN